MFQLYAQSRLKGWITKDDKIGNFVSNNIDELELLAEKFSPREYYEYMIIEHRKDGDRIARRQELSKDCEVEFVDDIKSKVEVKTVVFKPSRMKQKEELMREVRDYIDR